MFKKQIKLIILILPILLVVSGCGKQLETISDDRQVINEELKNEGEEVVLVEEEDLGSEDNEVVGEGVDVIEKDEVKDVDNIIKWKTYRDENYGFEMLIPENYREIGVGLEGVSQEEVDNYSEIFLGTGILHSIRIYQYKNNNIEKLYLSGGKIYSQLFQENKMGAKYFLVREIYEKEGLLGYDFVCFDGNEEEKFICITIRNKEGNSEDFLYKVINSFIKF